jgi:hypothetical protein
MGLCSETKIRDPKVDDTLVVEVNKFGQVLSVKAIGFTDGKLQTKGAGAADAAEATGGRTPVDLLLKILEESNYLTLRDVQYGEDEEWFEKTLRGASFYSSGTCCWKLVRKKWKCREEYC